MPLVKYKFGGNVKNKKSTIYREKPIDKCVIKWYNIQAFNRRIKSAGVAELVDARDLKSRGTNVPCRFDPGLRHQFYISRGRAVR